MKNGSDTKLKVRITLKEELLGTASSNPEIHREFIASKAPNAPSMEEEVATLGVEAVESKGKTVFPKDTAGRPIFWDYQIKGFFKDACAVLSRVPTTRSKKLKAFRKVIDGLVFPQPRQIPLHLPEGAAIGECQRPIRVVTMQGERTALANSETVPAGTKLEFEVLLLDKSLKETLIEWLDYGQLRGLGQWRNSGKGRFDYEIVSNGEAANDAELPSKGEGEASDRLEQRSKG